MHQKYIFYFTKTVDFSCQIAYILDKETPPENARVYHQHARHVEVALGVSLFFVAKTVLIKILGGRFHSVGVELQTIFVNYAVSSIDFIS